jgi:hypothetical protein
MTKISALSDIGTSVASNDAFVLVDVSDPTTPNKKIQQQNLLAAGGLLPDGSVGTPGLRFLNDTNVGLYRPTTDALAFVTAGQNRLHITSAGLVGIGTSVPGYLFEASRNSTGDVVAFTASTDRLRPLVFSSSDNTASGAIWTRKIDSAFGIHAWSTNSVERMRLDSSGNVGIGTTSPTQPLEVTGNARINGVVCLNHAPSAWSSAKAFEGPYGGSLSFDESYSYTTLASNSFYDGSNWKYKISVGASRYSLGDLASGGTGTHQWFRAASGTAGNNISWLESMRLDTSGRLLVGTSTARSNYFNQAGIAPAFQVVGADHSTSSAVFQNTAANLAGPYFHFGKSRGTSYQIVSNDDYLGIVSFQGADGSTMREAASISAQVDGTPGANDMPGRLVFSTTADGGSSPTERMRITNKGVVRIGETYIPGVTAGYLQVFNGSSSQSLGYIASDTFGNQWHFGRSSVDGYFYVVRQTGTGMYMDTNSWVATSDQRVKQNIADIESTIDVVKALKPSRFNWKADGSADVGFIAQQVQPLIPEAVVDSGDPDAMLGITQDKLLPFVVKALQEAVAKIESLEARLTAAGV